MKVQEIFQNCLERGGILLMQPEYLLSFELMGLESVLSDQLERGKTILDTQRWLNKHAPDVLDESDEILSTRFKLI